jgi:long-chain acyl-CoA synthetase
VSAETTFPRLLRRLAAEHPEDHALREKRYGIWQATTWAQYEQRVRRFAQGLAALGFQRGETIALLGDNRPEWLIAELAAQSLGGASLGLPGDSDAAEVARLLAHARVRFVVAEDQEQVDKLVELMRDDDAAGVERVVYYDTRGLAGYEQPYLYEFTDVEGRGDECEPGWWEQQVTLGGSADVAILCTTAGTTGPPKLVMLTYANLLSAGASLMSEDPLAGGDDCFSVLPLARAGEQVISVACALQSGLTLNFPESAATVRSDLREIGPRVLFCAPRTWESMLGQVHVRVGEAGWLKRRAFGWGSGVGKRAVAARLRDGSIAGPLRLQLALAQLVALRPVREQLGLTRVRRAYSGGGPLDAEVSEFFSAIGVNLKQCYGQTESCAFAAMQRDGEVRPHTVGTPLHGTELRVAADGEILLRSQAVFGGYLRDDAATAEALREGWLHTGDAGYVDDDGQLVVIDRAPDVVRAPDGTRFGLTLVERKLKLSPYVTDAVALGGEARPYVASVVSIDADNVAAWARRKQLGFSSYAELTQKPEVFELIAEHVARANEDLPEAARVRRFVVLARRLDADSGELTWTGTPRRAVIEERYADVIAALYRGDASNVAARSA